MKKTILIGALALALSACSEQKTEKCIHIDLTNIIEADAEKVGLNEWAKNVKFIPLETNDNILIKYIDNVYQKDNKFLVSHGGNRVSIFDKNGKYMHDISSKGEGPTNFINMHGQGLIDESGLMVLPAGKEFGCQVHMTVTRR